MPVELKFLQFDFFWLTLMTIRAAFIGVWKCIMKCALHGARFSSGRQNSFYTSSSLRGGREAANMFIFWPFFSQNTISQSHFFCQKLDSAKTTKKKSVVDKLKGYPHFPSDIFCMALICFLCLSPHSVSPQTRNPDFFFTFPTKQL